MLGGTTLGPTTDVDVEVVSHARPGESCKQNGDAPLKSYRRKDLPGAAPCMLHDLVAN